MRVAIVNSGACFQLECIEGDRYRDYFDGVLRPEALSLDQLCYYDVLVIPCHTPVHRIKPHEKFLVDYLNLGKTIVSTGRSKHEQFLPNISFEPCPTNFWWWKTEGETLGTDIVKPEHSLFSYIDLKAITWHLHGFYNVPAGAEILATGPNNRPLIHFLITGDTLCHLRHDFWMV